MAVTGAVLLGLSACARGPVFRTPLPTSLHGPSDAAADRLHAALTALRIDESDLARRPPRIAQCVRNADTARLRDAPAALTAWPPPALTAALSIDSPDAVAAWVLQVSSEPPGPTGSTTLRHAVQRWCAAAARARRDVRRALPGLAPPRLRDLAGPEHVGPPPATLPEAARADAAKAAAERRAAYCRVASTIPPRAFHAALADLWVATRALERAVASLPRDAWPAQAERWTMPDGFVVAVGSLGPDVIEPGWHLWLDPGGDDDVAADAPSDAWPVQAAVDLGGDDHYRVAAGGAGVAGVVGGLSILLDAAGDDAYDGGRWSVGAAAFGGALLVDRAGNDAYAARSAGVAAAFQGVALVLDGGGTDVYSVGVQGEAFAGPAGFALLWDGEGDDVYDAGGLIADTVSGAGGGATLGMAQGCAFGLRPQAEGGTALLVDLAGDDRYRGAVFAQGVGYWGGAGFLWDAAGDDTYAAVQYAQGTGLHFGVGVLSDGGGNDTYTAGGLAQGCGHDLGIGVCVETAGDDRYAAKGLASGASSGGGLGMFWDGGGADQYAMSPVNNLGCDGSLADRPGIAIHVDAGGRDQFRTAGTRRRSSAPARDGATWFNGNAGVGVNLPDPGATPHAQPAPVAR